MPDVLIRDVPPRDLEEIRSAASECRVSLQAYLRDAVHAHAAYLRRRAALRRTADRLATRPPAPEEARQAVLDAVDTTHEDRAAQLVDPSA